MSESQIGLIGLGVMGKSLALNIASRNYKIAAYNRYVQGKEENIASSFEKDHKEAYPSLKGFDELQEFVDALEKPRKIIMMVNAGPAVDAVVQSVMPFLDKEDVLIDGGNSHYEDTKRRYHDLLAKGIHYVGCGISGGEEGALKGPSLMPGGSEVGYEQIKDILDAIAAKDEVGGKCCTYIGAEGAGHFVKMIHNGIEYGEMQLIAEAYDVLRNSLKYPLDKISEIFKEWNEGELKSYLLEISRDILTAKEGEDYLLDKILDVAGQKGTGGWSTTAALSVGMPFSTISEAVMARCLSAQKENRVKASLIYGDILVSNSFDDDLVIEQLKDAYQAARIINHAIGFQTIMAKSDESNWHINLSELARVWTNGCIIRSTLMTQLIDTYKTEKQHLLLNDQIAGELKKRLPGFSQIIGISIMNGHSLPVFSAALNYINAFKSKQMPTNMIQAQRDYFGAHTYKRVDQPIEESFHTLWKEVIQ